MESTHERPAGPANSSLSFRSIPRVEEGFPCRA
jgi:hypothetical protein